jgi:hypothetical protein
MSKQTITEFLLERGKDDVVFESIQRFQKQNKISTHEEAKNELLKKLKSQAYKKEYNKKHYAENKEYYYNLSRNWKLANPEKNKKTNKKYKEKIKKLNTASWQKQQADMKEYQKKWYQKNKKRLNEKKDMYRKNKKIEKILYKIIQTLLLASLCMQN